MQRAWSAPDRPELDPEIAIFVERMSAGWAEHPPFATLPIEEARRGRREGPRAVAAKRPGNGADLRSISFRRRPGRCRTGFTIPGSTSPAPALIYLHGGGFILFSLDTHDRLMREYAAAGQFRGARRRLSAVTRGALSQGARPDRRTRRLAPSTAAPRPSGIDSRSGWRSAAISRARNLSVATALRLRDRGSAEHA